MPSVREPGMDYKTTKFTKATKRNMRYLFTDYADFSDFILGTDEVQNVELQGMRK